MMSALAAFMPLYVGDYLRDTSRLTTEGHGAYLLLIFDYWTSGRPLPDDDSQLAAIAKLSKFRWQKLRKNLAPFFIIGDGVWRHKRIETELEKRIQLSAVRSEAGRKGQANARANALAKREQTREQNANSHSHRSVSDSSGEVRTKAKHQDSPILEINKPSSARAREGIGQINGCASVEKNDVGNPLGRCAPLRGIAAPGLRSKKKEQLRQKLLRFADYRFAGDARRAAIAGLCGSDPEHTEQWWLDTLDIKMRAEQWDDTR